MNSLLLAYFSLVFSQVTQTGNTNANAQESQTGNTNANAQESVTRFLSCGENRRTRNVYQNEKL